ncbi:nuclear transport factor 2 family protein [Chromobacterium sp. CV08]|uniref:nuclear transport factor 2 family protein n=1 Tax=Chromobacterium sp. CV08 TaxID=3133274 RepID=UPI003DA963ED
MGQDEDQVFAAIRCTLAQIERWLGDGPHAPEALARLMADFDAGFTMVTPGGARLDREALRVFFQRAAGSRPGLAIALERMTLLAGDGQAATVAYYETQAWGDGGNGRHATAVLRRDGAGWRWRHLQETGDAG